jgi:putative ABC transport system substrate-binding protein
VTRVLLGAFLALTLLAVPLAAEAEPRARRCPKIGVVYLSNGPVETWLALPPVKAFLEGMEELHWENDRDFVLDIRPVVDYARVQNVVASLVAGRVDVLLFVTCDTEFHIARRTTHRIPIVIGPCADDLVGKGVVASLARPGGNITGQTIIAPDVTGKRLELLREVVPALTRVAVLWNPDNPVSVPELKETQAAARSLGLELQSLHVSNPADFRTAFSSMVQARADALVVFSDAMFFGERNQIADLAAKSRLPAISWTGEFAKSGGLMGYGPDVLAIARRAATYVDKILKGVLPADLPIEQPVKFEFVVNLKTARALGLTIPQALLLRADDVIQ